MDEVSKRRIAASAELLDERRENDHATGVTREDVPDDRLAALEGPVFERYDGVVQYLGVDEWPADEALPEWMDTCSALVDHVRGLDDATLAPDLGDQPFVDCFAPMVDYARTHHLDESALADADRLSASAVADLEAHLVDRLVEVGAQAIHVDFLTYVNERAPEVIEEERRSPDSTEWYDEYVAAFRDGRIVDCLERYPVLARLLVVVVRQWAAAVSRFAARLADDYDALCSLCGDDLGPAVAVDAGVGDTHDEGQTVAIVGFESGHEVVYKPRTVEAERQLYEFQTWLAERFDRIPRLQTLDLLDRSTYGWVEKLDRTPFEDLEAVADYYRRAGAFLFVLYLLRGTDCHYENVVAGDISPVLVDAETVPNTPVVEDPEPSLAEAGQRYVYRSTVLETMTVPFEVGDKEMDHSGLGMTEATPSRRSTVSWLHTNTDAMDVEYAAETKGPGENFPTVAGDPVPPERFLDELVEGFEVAYEAVTADAEAVKARVTDQFAGVQLRNVLQESMTYGGLLDTLTTPQYLKSGVDHECKVVNTLAARFTSISRDAEEVLDAERRAILRRDIPRFTMPADDETVRFDGEPVFEAPAGDTGLDRILSRIDALSADDRAYQRGLLRTCFGGTAPTAGEHGCGDL